METELPVTLLYVFYMQVCDRHFPSRSQAVATSSTSSASTGSLTRAVRGRSARKDKLRRRHSNSRALQLLPSTMSANGNGSLLVFTSTMQQYSPLPPQLSLSTSRNLRLRNYEGRNQFSFLQDLFAETSETRLQEFQQVIKQPEEYA